MSGGDPQTPSGCAGGRIRLLAPALPGHGLRPPRAPSPVLGSSWGPVASALVGERADFRAPKGTQDVLPPESGRWAELIATFAGVAGRFGYGLIQSPMFEGLGVFTPIGAGTDAVSKGHSAFHPQGHP